MKGISLASFLAFSSIAQTTPTGVGRAPRPSLRDLEFGDINFLHTTDTHGWHAGHLLEPSYNANWGDYISFSEHLRGKLEAQGKDLLVIDTGDRIEGNGLYDASEPRGKYTFGIFDQQQVDLLCVGNHELYKNTSAEDDYTKLVPAYNDNYIASNLKILDPKSGKLEPFTKPLRKFTTKNGVRILSFGFIFDFTRNDKNTVITPVEIAVKEPWFQHAIKDQDIDLVVVIGHVALRQQEFENIHKEIRNANSTIPIQFFGGHFHIRDYRVFDHKSHALASGRFMETIGFQSISNLRSDKPKFFRRYIDNNLISFMHHSNSTEDTFHTKRGLATTKKIAEARKALDLDKTFGYAPQTYWMSQVPFDDSSSVFSLLANKVLPDIVQPARSNRTRMMITNTGAIRFDIFAGAFTRDSTFIVSPFTSNLSFIPDVPYRLAKHILPVLNNGNPQTSEMRDFRYTWETLHYAQRNKLKMDDLASPEEQARRSFENSQREVPHTDSQSKQEVKVLAEPVEAGQSVSPSIDLTPGYTTRDDLGIDGDDTPHSPIPAYAIPNCIQAVLPAPSSSILAEASCNLNKYADEHPSADEEVVDLIFNAFLTPYIVKLLNLLPFFDKHYKGELAMDHKEYRHNAGWAFTTFGRLNDLSLNDQYWGENIDRFRSIRQRDVELGLHEDLAPPVRSTTILGAMSVRDSIDTDYEKPPTSPDASKPVERPVWGESDVQNYIPGETFTTLLAKWVSENWTEKNKHGEEVWDANTEL